MIKVFMASFGKISFSTAAMAALMASICGFSPAMALTPLQGLSKGDVADIVQNDPLRGIFTEQFFSKKAATDQGQKEKLEKYKALISMGANLLNSCSVERFYTYQDSWTEEGARRAVAATLQYLGLDISSRAIVEYAKAFKLSQGEFENVVNNLVVNTCSENISVFSKKLLRNNFMDMWEGKTDFKAPSFKDSPFVTDNNFEKTESFESKRKEFAMALKNFRDFCSWNGDTENYSMLAPYLKNPYLMSYVFNHLNQRKIEWDETREAAVVVPFVDSARVACQDLICRKRDPAAFERLFPRMVGSAGIEDDLEVLYCNHFRDIGPRSKDASPSVKKWLKKQTLEEAKLSPMSMVSFITGVPDLFFSAERFPDLLTMFSDTIEHRWDEWARGKTKTLQLDLLYEESLFIDLVPASPLEKARGELDLVFDFTLGELDRELEVVDKVGSTFHLSFPKSYLAWVRRSYISAANRSDYKELENIQASFETYVDLQLKEKSKLFLLPLWNEKFSKIIAEELQERLSAYKGSGFDRLEEGKIEVPIKFRFGLFALKYLRDKFKAEHKLN